MSYQNVILVDRNDNAIGEEEKLAAHEKGMLHRAFSIFIYKKTSAGIELLMQQRAKEKYHCGGLWTNTCCSHPIKEKDINDCVHERLLFEMGIDKSLSSINFIDKFFYKADFDNGLTEHEIDHVFISEYNGESITPNPDEVSQYAWVNVLQLEADLIKTPQKYTPWLKQVLDISKVGLQQ